MHSKSNSQFAAQDRISTLDNSDAAVPSSVGTENGADQGHTNASSTDRNSADFELLGQIVSLMTLSPQHRYLFLADLEWFLRPAMSLGQCRLFRRKGHPFAFIAWAFVSDEVAGRLQALPGRLRPDEWKCGTRPMIVQVVAPFGGADACISEVMKASQTKSFES